MISCIAAVVGIAQPRITPSLVPQRVSFVTSPHTALHPNKVAVNRVFNQASEEAYLLPAPPSARIADSNMIEDIHRK